MDYSENGPVLLMCLVLLVPSVFMIIAGSNKNWACKSGGKPINLQSWLLGYGCMFTILFGSAVAALLGLEIGDPYGTVASTVFAVIVVLTAVFGLVIFNQVWAIIGIVELATTKKDKCSDIVYNTSIAAVVVGCLICLALIGGFVVS